MRAKDSLIPNHSILSNVGKRWGNKKFKSLFDRIVLKCVESGLAKRHLPQRELYGVSEASGTVKARREIKKGQYLMGSRQCTITFPVYRAGPGNRTKNAFGEQPVYRLSENVF